MNGASAGQRVCRLKGVQPALSKVGDAGREAEDHKALSAFIGRSWRTGEGSRLIFLHGFAKNETDNITNKERLALLALGEYMSYAERTISELVAKKVIVEVVR